MDSSVCTWKGFRRFHDFLASEVQRERDKASAAYEQRWKALRDLQIIDDAVSETVEELQLDEPNLAEMAKAFLEASQHRRLAAMNGLLRAG